MVEGMLRHVGHSQACGFPDLAFCWLRLTNQDFDGSRLPCSVGANHSHAAHLRHRETHACDSGLILCRVLEAHVAHTEDHLAAAFDSFHGTRLWENKSHGLVAELKIRLLLRILLNELRQGGALHALERLQLPVLEIDDVGAHLVQERAEVRGADDAARKRLQPVLEPLDVVHIQVTCGLVKHEHIRIHQLRSTELHLHLPASRVGGNWKIQVCCAIWPAWVAEACLLHQLSHLLLRDLSIHLVDVVAGELHPPPARLVHAQDGEAIILNPHLHILDLMLNEDTLQLITLREALQLLIGNGAHQCRLAALVWAKQAIEAVTLQVHLRIPEERQCAVGQRKGALVEVHALVILLLDLLLRLRGHLHLGSHLLDHTIKGSHCSNRFLPGVRVEDPHVSCRGR
mmetsp:Transcript_5911/g.13185  ORF Transcript_5911/g.13185 Transcript_5911/m.13185 type:complete len:400 (-) Transcript_5911:1045-2244(-)